MTSTATTGLNLDQARVLAITGAGLTATTADPVGVLAELGVVQLDSINAVARAHQLTLTGRATHLTAAAADDILWNNPEPVAFDHPAHALSLVPLHDWPLWAFRRRATRRRPDYPDTETARTLLDRIERDGPLTMRQLRGDEEKGGGWDWGPTKTAVEFLVWAGELACTRRTGWQRLFDLPNRVIPDRHLTDHLDDRECHLRLLERAGRVLGAATADDLADYLRLPTPLTRTLLPDTTLTPVTVDTWTTPAWAHPDALGRLHHLTPPDRALFLGPFDNLVWYRPRVQRLFDFTHTLEAYKPAAQRVYGYYACPLLVDDRLVGRADLARHGTTLTILRTSLDTPSERNLAGFADACHNMANTVGCHDITVTPDATDSRTRRALQAALDTHSSPSQ
ncbi:crosslink repair DNA glycosylase YcaQ family protein [Actinosynnema sp. NPDC023587]|uniref:winged helix-turn-helix domain-containing protein n=1 Tax=Actinosynnema sp. NPDC023587 TaxID=3154695 RepID=UPI0033DBEDC3